MVNNHYVINDTTDLTAYNLEHYDEVKDIADCHLAYKKTDKYYNKDKTGTRFIKAFQLFKILKVNIGKPAYYPHAFNRKDYAHTIS